MTKRPFRYFVYSYQIDSTSPSNTSKLENMAPKNATWLKHLEAAMGHLARLAQNIQGEKGVCFCWFVITNCFCVGARYYSVANFIIFFFLLCNNMETIRWAVWLGSRTRDWIIPKTSVPVCSTDPFIDDVRKHEEVPLFAKNLLERQTIYREVALCSEEDKSAQYLDMWGDSKFPLGVYPKKWRLCVAQRYVIDQ